MHPVNLNLKATPEMVECFRRRFVNRLAFPMQSSRPHPESGRFYYYRPTVRETGSPIPLTASVVRQHLEGAVTIGLYAINPETQRCKWLAIDADYRNALEDLLRLHCELSHDGIEAALEKSRRGGHLWMFFETPVLARTARLYVLNLAARLNLGVKGAGWPEGIEVFPRQDELRPGEFGNAIRAPLGVHRGAGKRYWFYHADYDLASQFAYLTRLRRVNEAELTNITAGMTIPRQFAAPTPTPIPGEWANGPTAFRILDHVEIRTRAGRNYVARCPSCAAAGHDTTGDNLSISVEEPQKYRCWAGCTKEMIRAAVGRPIEERRYA